MPSSVALPPMLTEPPWLRRHAAPEGSVLALPAYAAPTVLRWRDGEREEWHHLKVDVYPLYSEKSWPEFGRGITDGAAFRHDTPTFVLRTDDRDRALALLAAHQFERAHLASEELRLMTAKFEAAALPALLNLAERFPAEAASVIGPFDAPELAPVVADWLVRLKSVRRPAIAWLRRHPATAARALLPAALGPAGRQAAQALSLLVSSGHGGQVRAAAAAHGSEAENALAALLAAEAFHTLPGRLPEIPAWAEPAALPALPVRDGSGSLPVTAVANVVTALAISTPATPYAMIAEVREVCEPAAIAGFAWGLFEQWMQAGAPPKEGWAFEVLGLLGDDETARRLTPLLLAWPGEKFHARAVAGVDLLADIGSEVAMLRLYQIAQRAKFPGLKQAARARMADVAGDLGLSPDQLGDRIVPYFGLNADGGLDLDYGPRQFVVGFDEQLLPYVSDATGKRLRSLPRPSAKDDPQLAPAAHERFTGMKKDVKAIASDQIRRLERAMAAGRRWNGHEFRTLFATHPLLWHVVRRLVWGVYAEDGTLTGAFRMAEDRSFADVHDDTYDVADDAIVGVAHPVELGPDVGTWAELFTDYEIVQPFEQLSRPVHRLSAEEQAMPVLTRVKGSVLRTTWVLGMAGRGWARDGQSGGYQDKLRLPIGDGREVLAEISPGVLMMDITGVAEQTVGEVVVRHAITDDDRFPLAVLTAVAASEVVRDLTGGVS